MSGQILQLAGNFLAGNRKNFLNVEPSAAWLFDCPLLTSLLYQADNCFDLYQYTIKTL